jgi:dTDP-4-amino-4,6-dideoxygalactose transaminase
MASIRFGDLAREYQSIKAEIDDAVSRVLSSGWFVLGPEVEAFENAFAEYLGIQHCVGVASGTEAIALALRACDVGPGDEVVTVAHTAVPTVSAISMVSAIPVFVDIRPDTLLMDVERVAAAVTSRTRAIVPVHLYGQSVDMDPLLELARTYGVPVVEDCAQAHGATYKGKVVGTLGTAAAFSFYPSKNLGCYGDGGAVVSRDPYVAAKVRMLRNYGERRRYLHEIKGINSRLDELQAAILSAKLSRLEEWNRRRRAVAQAYAEGLHGLPVVLPTIGQHCYHVYHLFVIQSSRRDSLRDFLGRRDVQTLVHYPIPAHLQGAYGDLGYARGSLPVTEAAADSVLSLPMYPQIPDRDVLAVISVLSSFFSDH